MPLTFYLTEQPKRKDTNIFSYVPEFTFVLAVSAILLTDSQGVHITAIILFLMLLARLIIMNKFGKKFLLLTLAGVVLGFAAFSWKQEIMTNYREAVHVSETVSVDPISFERKNSVDTRMEHFKTGYNLAVTSPLFGYGPGSYPYVSASKLSLLNKADHPHNLFLKIAAENGIITLFAFIAFLGVTLLRSLLIFFQKLDPAREVVFLSIVAFLIHQMIDYNLNFASIEFIFYILLGTLIVERIRKSKRLHVKELRFVNHFMLVSFGMVLTLFALNDGISNAKAMQAANDDAYFNFRSKTLLKRSYFEDHAEYLISDDRQASSVIENGLALNPYNDALYALKGDYQKAYALNPHNLSYLLAVYETASEEHKAALKDDIRSVLNGYYFLLTTNAHFTILTENPIIALSLARLIDDRILSSKIELAIEDEKEKFGRLYNIPF